MKVLEYVGTFLVIPTITSIISMFSIYYTIMTGAALTMAAAVTVLILMDSRGFKPLTMMYGGMAMIPGAWLIVVLNNHGYSMHTIVFWVSGLVYLTLFVLWYLREKAKLQLAKAWTE